jgi:hypothetical protein
MKKLIGVFLIICSVLLLFGCASVKMASKEEDTALKKFELPSAGKAGLYIFRNSFTGQSLYKDVYVDSIFIGETANGVYFYLEILPGTHTISTESEFGENSVSFEAEGGKNYFAEQYVKMGVFVGGAGIEMVDESVGMQQVLDCELAEQQNPK